MPEKYKAISAVGLRRLLDDSFWLPSLRADGHYVFTISGEDVTKRFSIGIDRVEDVWFTTALDFRSLRFRTCFGGGGRSPKTRNALLILAFCLNYSEQQKISDKLEKRLEELVLADWWLPEIEIGRVYSRLHDDHDGKCVGRIRLEFLYPELVRIATDRSEGSWIEVSRSHGPVFAGLQILALAIISEKRLDPPVPVVED